MALCTAAQVRAYANAGTSADDTLIDTIIARVDAMFARWCMFPVSDAGTHTMEDATYTLYVDGRRYIDIDDRATLYLPIHPLVSVTSAHVDPERDYTAATLLSSSMYDRDLYRSTITLRDTATQSWSTATRANKIVGIFGYATIPADLEEAAVIQASHIYANRGTAGRREKSTGQNNVSVDHLSLLDEVRERLEPYRQTVP